MRFLVAAILWAGVFVFMVYCLSCAVVADKVDTGDYGPPRIQGGRPLLGPQCRNRLPRALTTAQ